MSSNTKNTITHEVVDVDDSVSYDDLNKKLEVITNSQKDKFNSLVDREGDNLLDGMEERKLKSNKKKIPYIGYILEHTDEYDEELLESFDLDEVLKIHYQIKKLNTPIWKKIWNFISSS